MQAKVNKMEQNKKELAKLKKEVLYKYFFDISKSTYTIMVLGGLAAWFGIVKTDSDNTGWATFFGALLTIILATIGYIILKNIKL